MYRWCLPHQNSPFNTSALFEPSISEQIFNTSVLLEPLRSGKRSIQYKCILGTSEVRTAIKHKCITGKSHVRTTHLKQVYYPSPRDQISIFRTEKHHFRLSVPSSHISYSHGILHPRPKFK